MALKGFLASGFQKLIGASRIQGANSQWLGEQNRIVYSSNTVPITASFGFGFNTIEWTPTSDVFLADGQALFTSNPTTPVQVTIRNESTNRTIIFGNNGSVAGSVVGVNQLYIGPGKTVTYLYDIGTSRWVEIGRPAVVGNYGATISGPSFGVGDSRIQSVQVSASTDQTVTSISPAVGSNTGDILYVICLQATNPITFQQDTTASVANGLIMNGDYVMTKYGCIAFYRGVNQWIEIFRSNVGGYV